MDSVPAVFNTEVVTVADIAENINQEYRLAVDCLGNALEHAIECGRMLLEVKDSVGHGNLKAWIIDNCEMSYRTAADYMRLAKVQSPALLHKSSISKALTALASDPKEETPNKEQAPRGKRGADWNGILSQFSRRKKVTYEELAEAAGHKNGEKVKRYSRCWDEVSGLVVERNGDAISVKSGGDAVVHLFEQLPSNQKSKTLAKMRLDDDVLAKTMHEFKRNNQTATEHVSGLLYKAKDCLHGIVQQYGQKSHLLRSATKEQSDDLVQVCFTVEHLIATVQDLVVGGLDGGKDGVSEE